LASVGSEKILQYLFLISTNNTAMRLVRASSVRRGRFALWPLSKHEMNPHAFLFCSLALSSTSRSKSQQAPCHHPSIASPAAPARFPQPSSICAGRVRGDVSKPGERGGVFLSRRGAVAPQPAGRPLPALPLSASPPSSDASSPSAVPLLQPVLSSPHRAARG
jgi:hypothetical protein